MISAFSSSLHLAFVVLQGISWSKISVYVSIALVSSVKFLVGVILAIGKPGFGFWDIMISAAGGAILGAVIFTFFGNQINKWLRQRFNYGANRSFARKRQIYMLWRKYGLLGVSALAPILSPMASIGIALSFQERPGRILTYVVGSILFWTTVLGLSKELVLTYIIN